MEDPTENWPQSGFPLFWREIATTVASAIIFHPLDTLKVRMQLDQGPSIQLVKKMVKHEGFGCFNKGLASGLLGQMTFRAVTNQTSGYLYSAAFRADGGMVSPEYRDYYCTMIGDVIGTVVCNPAELAKTRIQGDPTLPPVFRRNYKNISQALRQAASEEGITAVWRGAGTNALKATALNLGFNAAIGFHGTCDAYIGDDRKSRIMACLLFGIVPPVCSRPFDYVKTQLQMMQPDFVGRYPYAGPLDCALKTLKNGGPLKFYSGFLPYCFTFLPRTWLIYMLAIHVFNGGYVSVRT